jgi:hypothetical protein
MALRLSFELLLGTAYFSANELHLRQWLCGERDIVWSALIDSESGVLSKQFVRAFYEELTEEAPSTERCVKRYTGSVRSTCMVRWSWLVGQKSGRS